MPQSKLVRTVLSLGYPSSPPEGGRWHPGRKPLSELVHEERYGRRGLPPRGRTWMVLEALAPQWELALHQTLAEMILTSRAVVSKGDGQVSARGSHPALGKNRIVVVDGLVNMNPLPVFVRSGSL